jgi:hypothetical protein
MPQRPATWDDLVTHEARKAKVPPQLALALMKQESGGKPDVTSAAGAQGLMQLMPPTAASLGVDPADPVQNIRGGVTYLRQQLDATQGDVGLALARYHGGPDLAQHGPKTAAYVQSILGMLKAPAAVGAGAAKPGFVSPVLAAQLPQLVGQPPPKPPDPRGFEDRPPMTGGIEGSRFDPKVQEWEKLHAAATSDPSADQSFLQSMAGTVDPRTAEGRQNIAAGVGAAAGALLTRSPVGTRAGATLGARAMAAAPRMLAAATGAGVGGAAAETGEQVVGGAPPDPRAVAVAGATQAGYEVGGAVALWPVRAIGRRIIAGPVGRHAAEGLSRAKQGVIDQTHAAIAAAKDLTKRTTSALGATLKGTVGTPPPVPSTVGRQVQRVIEGPARTAREMAGQAVEEAAETGPAVNIGDLKAEAQRVVEAEIRPAATAFPRTQTDGPDAMLAAAGLSPGAMSSIMAKGGPNAQAVQQAIAAAQGEAEKDLLKHPAMGVINRILNAEDDVPFAAAHQFKRELDEAVGAGNWDRSVQKRVTNITKGLRGALRERLSVHAPYNRATAHYATIAPLYTKEIAPKLRKLAATRPEALISMIKGGEPTPAKMLRELLTTQAEAGGGGAEGRAAWDQVRASWTHEKILRGGVEKLEGTIGKLDPEFVEVMYGDVSGQQVLANMKAISAAYQQAIAREPAALQAAKAAGRQGLDDVKADMARLTKSTIGRRPMPGETWADLIRAGMVPTTFWGAYSIGRLLKGPASADLIEWAAYSPQNTQRLVRAFTSPVPSVAVADLLRTTVLPTVERLQGSSTSAGAPPPQRAVIGAPPPR